MRTKFEILVKINSLLDNYSENTVSGKIDLITPIEIKELRRFMKLFDMESIIENVYLSDYELDLLLLIIASRKADFTSLEAFLDIKPCQKQLMQLLVDCNLDKNNNLALLYHYRSLIETLFKVLQLKSERFKEVLVKIFTAKDINAYIKNLEIIINFEGSHQHLLSQRSILSTARSQSVYPCSEEGLLALTQLIQFLQSSDDFYYDSVASIKITLSNLLEVALKSNETLILIAKEYVKGYFDLHKNEREQESKLLVLKRLVNNINFNILHFNGLGDDLVQLNKILRHAPARKFDNLKKYSEDKFELIECMFVGKRFSWLDDTELFHEKSLIEIIRKIRIKTVLSEPSKKRAYELLSKVMNVSDIKKPDILERVVGMASYMTKARAMQILNESGMLTFNNYILVTHYERLKNDSIYAAASLWIAKEIKELYWQNRTNEILKKMNSILEKVKLIKEDRFWDRWFKTLLLICNNELYTRPDYLDIVQTVLEAMINNPFSFPVSFAIQCCVAEHVKTADFIDIVNIRCDGMEDYRITTSCVDSLVDSLNGFVRTLDKDEISRLYQAYMDDLKLVKDTNCESFSSKRDRMTFFKPLNRSDCIDKTKLYSIEKPLYNVAEPLRFSLANDKPRIDVFGKKAEDVVFRFG